MGKISKEVEHYEGKDAGGRRMTDREKAIVMAYTGTSMLTGNKFQIFHKYVEDIMGRPVWTHEMGIKSTWDEIKAKSKDDFIALCADESGSENPNEWIPVSERLPEEETDVLVCCETGAITVCCGSYSTEVSDTFIWYTGGWRYGKVIAWMPLPKTYRGVSE